MNDQIEMICPRCNGSLRVEDYKGIQIDRCLDCRGLWLDYDELDQLESTVLNQDEQGGTTTYARRTGDLKCPKCKVAMTTFNYRAYNLPLDVCESGHGFWLDHDEENKVIDLMRLRVGGLKRSKTAEGEWIGFLKGGTPKSFIDKIKRRFKG